jgi:hypothetical protein
MRKLWCWLTEHTPVLKSSIRYSLAQTRLPLYKDAGGSDTLVIPARVFYSGETACSRCGARVFVDETPVMGSVRVVREI